MTRRLQTVGLLCLLLTGCASNTLRPDGQDAASPSAVSIASRDSGISGLSSVNPRDVPGATLQPIATVPTGSRHITSLSAPVDLWDRIRRSYAMPDLESDLVRDREQWYSAKPEYIFRMTERSRKYLFYIVEELERRNMPTELALLPFIESAFNPQAVSSAKAAGMWQFIPSTGKHFELKQNVFRDDRRDVMASTRAALDYLQKLYGMFGDWHLALAAYNWGEGSVSRAITKNQRLLLATGYPDLTMPMETRFYVPKLQAMKNIVANPRKFGVKLPSIGNHPYFDTVQISRDIDVALAAKFAEIPLDDFKALNPSLNKPVILAAGMPQILLPWDNAEIFQRNFQAFVGARMASWTVWVAPTTLRASEVAKRVGMNENDLRTLNNIPQRMLIRAGSTLLVPRPVGLSRDVTVQAADNGQVTLSPEVITRKTTVKAGKHDTVASLAKRYGVSAANVAEWNHVSVTAGFSPKQSVVLFLPVKKARGAAHATKGKPSRVAPH